MRKQRTHYEKAFKENAVKYGKTQTVLDFSLHGEEVKRFVAYQTIGGLFLEAIDGVIQLSVTEKIWGVLQKLVRLLPKLLKPTMRKSLIP
jgi:hypothetical protein